MAVFLLGCREDKQQDKLIFLVRRLMASFIYGAILMEMCNSE